MHLKRQKIPKAWPIPRKGTAYVVKPSFGLTKGIPILIILRDILKLAQNRKEVKKAVFLKQILLNSRPITEEKSCAMLFDTITIVPAKKHYRIELSEKGKFAINEIKETESTKKISKVSGKKTMKKKKTQLNLSDGKNFLSDIKCKVNDSVIINLKDKKIEKCLELKEKANVIVVQGKHSGKKGTIAKIIPERKMVGLDIGKEKINVLIKQLIVIE